MVVLCFVAALIAVPAAALAAGFDDPRSSDPSQQFEASPAPGPYGPNVQRQDTPNDENYDEAEVQENGNPPSTTNIFDERFDLFGFASQNSRGSAKYLDPGNPPGKLGRAQISGFNAAGAWKITRGLPSVTVAILDTGINWDNRGLRRQVALNAGELPKPEGCTVYDCKGNGDGFNVDDYADDSRVSESDGQESADSILDGSDLIAAFSKAPFRGDGDSNGYVDDIAGWDFFDDDNNPADTSSYFAAENHGSGRTSEAVEQGNDGLDSIGVCPKCQHMPVRIWDTFVSDQNSFFMGVVYATDNGAEVIEGADGGLYHSDFAEQASDYAYEKGVSQLYSGDDLNTGNHNFPAAYDHAMLIQGTSADSKGLGMNVPAQNGDPGFRNALVRLLNTVSLGTSVPLGTYFRGANTTQFGGKSSISMEGATGSANTGKAAGAAALVISAARAKGIELSPDELRILLEQTAEDILPGDTGGTGNPDPAQVGFETHFGYGRVNLGEAVREASALRTPPEADIESPDWYAPVTGDTVRLTGLADSRPSVNGGNFTWRLEYGLGLAPTSFTTVRTGSSSGAPVTDFGTLPLAQIRQQLAAREANNTPLGHPDRDDPAGPTLDSSDPKLDPYRGQFTARVVVAPGNADNPAPANVKLGVDRKVLTAIDDPTLRPDFPKRLGTGGEAPLRYADLNGDNVQELVLPTEDGLVHAFRPDGSELPGWPVRTETQFAARAHLSSPALQVLKPPLEPPRGPTIADLTGDGRPEVITAAAERIYIWNSAGELLPGWPVNADPTRANCALSEQEKERRHPKCGFLATPAVARLEGPGKPLDIVAPGLDGRLRAYRPDATVVPGFPVRLIDPDTPREEQVTAESINQPAIGDLDNDGRDDIIVPTNEVYGGEANGGGGDVGFGGLLSAAGTTARVYAVKSTGRGADGTADPFIEGWPIKPGGIIQNVLPLIGPGHDPALVRVNGQQRIVVSVTGGALSLYRPDGTLDKDIQQNVGGASQGALNLFESAVVGDLEGAGGPDLVKYQVDLGQAANLALVGQNFPYSHRIGAFNAATGAKIGPYPVITDDYQFLSSSTVGKVAPGATNQVLAPTGLGLLHAYDGLTGRDAPGFPKVTGGWMFAPPALSDDGRIAGITREGYLFEWNASGAPPCQTEWPSFRHDPQGSGNYDRDGTAPASPDELALTLLSGNSFRLSFRSPGDDGFCGSATRYVADVDGQTLDLGTPVAGGETFTKDLEIPAGARRVTIRAADAPADAAFNLGAPGALERTPTGGFVAVAPPGTGPNTNAPATTPPGTTSPGTTGPGANAPGTNPSARKPRLKLALRFRKGRAKPARRGGRPRRCARSGVRVTVKGADRRRAKRATFRVGRRALRDKRRPLSRVFRGRHRGASHVHKVRVTVRMRSGRLVRLSRRYRVCAGR